MIEELLKEKRIKVFVPDEDLVWITAEIIQEVKQGHFEIEITDGDYPKGSIKRKVITMKSLCRPMDVLPLQNDALVESGVADMVTLNYLHEASILDNLRRRFASAVPYTYTGEICIAVNPYNWLNIYTESLQEMYKERMRHELQPHVYSTSAVAYRGLRDYDRNQSILVSGESGAGKTETVKILMSHLAHISGRTNDKTIIKVLEANPLLESFGNAKTARNDNSSRFGKFTQLQFDKFTVLAGSKCVTYLLERSRVVTQNDAERNYHIFHQVFAAPPQVKEALHLSNLTCKDFRYTSRGDTVTHSIEGVSDGHRFAQTIGALELLGVQQDKRSMLTRILAGILYLGEVQFVGDNDKSSVDPGRHEATRKCCDLLGLGEEDFMSMTTFRHIEVNGQKMPVGLSLREASDGRDALAKDIYERLFQWLVLVVNQSTSAPVQLAELGRTVSLLDIFGFESFKINRFEQLCINFANEKLQQKFTTDVFKAVQDEYKEEGLEWDLISYRDNSDVLDLLEGRLGVMAMLNEECLMPQGSDQKYLGKLGSACNRHPCFGTSVYMSKDEFSITHYAGKVLYNVIGFVERNWDALPSDIKALMLTSNNDVLLQLYSIEPESTPSELTIRDSRSSRSSTGLVGRRASFMKADTVTTKFRAQLATLMEMISMTYVQYVRCIKPNAKKSATLFDRPMIVGQLRCAGMIEAIRISRAAYPYRITHVEFIERFGGLRSKAWMRRRTESPTASSQCKALLQDVLPVAMQPVAGERDKHYELGRSKVYFSAGVLEHLEQLRGKLVFTHICTIQRVWRGTSMRRRYLRTKHGCIVLQAVMRGFIAKRHYRRVLCAAQLTQRLARGRAARRQFAVLYLAHKATIMQSFVRMASQRRRFRRIHCASVVVGAFIKMHLQVKKYRLLLTEARENAKMSNQLEALRRRLEQEASQRIAAEESVKVQRVELEVATRALVDGNFSMSQSIEKQHLSSTPVDPGLSQPTASLSELQALTHLQAELAKQQRRVEFLDAENRSLREGLRGGSKAMDLKAGELALGRVALEDLEREKVALKTDKEKAAKLNSQYNLEKTVLMDSLLELGHEVDEAHRQAGDLYRRLMAERATRKALHQATVDFLAARDVSPALLEELSSFVARSLVSDSLGDIYSSDAGLGGLASPGGMSDWEASFLAMENAGSSRRRRSVTSSEKRDGREGRRRSSQLRESRRTSRSGGRGDHYEGFSDGEGTATNSSTRQGRSAERRYSKSPRSGDGSEQDASSPMSIRFDSDTPMRRDSSRGIENESRRSKATAESDGPPEQNWIFIRGLF